MCVFKDFSLIVYFCFFYCQANIRKVILSLQRFENLTCFVFPFLSFYPNSSVLKEKNSFIYFLKLPINYLRSYLHRLLYWKTKVIHWMQGNRGCSWTKLGPLELEFSGYWSEPSSDNDWWKRISPRLLGFLLKETREETYFSFFSLGGT